MKHRFYIKPQKEQNRIQFGLAFGVLIILSFFFFMAWKTGVYLIAFLGFSILISIIAPFFDTPQLKRSGKLIYYSALFIAEKPKNGIIKIHGGTLFDYIFVLEKNTSGKQRTNIIIQQFLEGLLNLIEEIQYQDNTSEIEIHATSYILNSRTAERIGFRIAPTDSIQKLILYFNFFNILLANSIAKKKIAIPPLKNIKTYKVNLKDLTNRKEEINMLIQALKGNSNSL